ncbi:hypothetical protein FQZ97_1086720 [compost metagenome]
MRAAAREFHDFQAAYDFAHGVGMYLAVFRADDFGKPLSVLFQQFLEAAEDPRAAQRRGGRPARKGRLGRSDGRLQFGGVRQGNPGADFSRGRVVYVRESLAIACDRLAVDVVVQQCGHGFSPHEWALPATSGVPAGSGGNPGVRWRVFSLGAQAPGGARAALREA